MVENYIQNTQNQSNRFQVLKPNIKKLFLKNLSNLIAIVLLIIILLLVINRQVGLGALLIPLETIGISINSSSIISFFILIILGIFVFLLGGNYLVAINSKYEFYSNKLVAHQTAFLIFVKSKDVPYQNIVKVSYNRDGFFDRIFNSGTVVLELTGIKEDRIRMEFLDNAEQTAGYIDSIRRRFASIQQAQFAEDYKMGKIVNRY